MIKELYLSGVKSEIEKHPPQTDEIITEDDIKSLPEPVKRFFRYCGYLGEKKMINAQIEWTKAYIKRDTKGDWMDLESVQFNGIPEPTRIAYLKSKIFGLIPFEGRDSYQDGEGHMLIKALKFIKVVDARGKKMDASGLVTVLSEFILVPSYGLQNYITWTSLDSNRAEATLTYNGIQVSGVFYFNEEVEIVKFETDHRYYTAHGEDPQNYRWTVQVDRYKEQDGIKIPSNFRASWQMENSEYQYFKGTIKDIQFNITHPHI